MTTGRSATDPRGSLTLRWAGLSALVSLALAGAVGCGPPAGAERGTTPVHPIGTLHAPGEYSLELTIDQEVTAEHVGGSESFRAVLEKRGDRVVMVGLGPHGGRAFVLTQDGEEVHFESQMPRELPFPPEFMLMDIHRTWLRGLPREGGAALPDGRHEAFLEGENVSEEWAGGRLLERHYAILASNLAWWSVHITYEGGLGADGSLPTRVVIDSTPAPEQHYRLVLDHLAGSITSGQQTSESNE
jgi:hypothetical protein